MNDEMNIIEKLKNNLVKKYYIQQESLFKLIYDKYCRKEIYEEITKPDFLKINKSEKSIKRKMFLDSVKWYKLIIIDKNKSENLSNEDKNIESKTYQYFKYHTFIIKGQFFLYFLSAITIVSGGVYLLVRSNYKRKMFMQSVCLGLILTILPLNLILLIMVNFEYRGKEQLISSFSNELIIYNKFYLKNNKSK